MRTLLVVLFLKTSPGLLLLPPGPCRRIRRFPLQRLMQPFPTSVLLRLAGVNPLRDDPQLHPPCRQPRQSAHGQRRQRWPLVGAQRSRQSILAESRFPHWFHLPVARARQQLTAQQVTAASIAQRQRLAALPVAGQKPALEVGAPQRIRLPGMRQRLAPGCCPPPPLGALPSAPAAAESPPPSTPPARVAWSVRAPRSPSASWLPGGATANAAPRSARPRPATSCVAASGAPATARRDPRSRRR